MPHYTTFDVNPAAQSAQVMTVPQASEPKPPTVSYSQIDQAQARIDATSSQIEGANIQSREQGVNQTQQLGGQLRQSASSVAQDMSSMISSTRAAEEAPNANDSVNAVKSYNMGQPPQTGIDATPPPPSSSPATPVSFEQILDELTALQIQLDNAIKSQNTAQISALRAQASQTLKQGEMMVGRASAVMASAFSGLMISLATVGVSAERAGGAPESTADKSELDTPPPPAK